MININQQIRLAIHKHHKKDLEIRQLNEEANNNRIKLKELLKHKYQYYCYVNYLPLDGPHSYYCSITNTRYLTTEMFWEHVKYYNKNYDADVVFYNSKTKDRVLNIQASAYDTSALICFSSRPLSRKVTQDLIYKLVSHENRDQLLQMLIAKNDETYDVAIAILS